jgi:hypothetical protein
MRKQTAVEWLVEQIKFNLIAKPILENGEVMEFYLPKGERLDELAKRAKEMEDEQLLEYWKGGIQATEEGGVSFDVYHNGTELKKGDEVKLEGYDYAWIGWVTNSSYLICKIKSRYDENGKTSRGWMLMNMEVHWVLKSDWHSKN